jgi:predicted DNA-binding transcriptional regulator
VATLSNQKDHELKGNFGRVYKSVLQSGAKGIRAVEIADKLGLDKTTVYPHLNSLRHKGLVESVQGVWSAKTGEHVSKSLDKEIVIELPLPKDQAVPIGLLEILAKDCERAKFPQTAEIYRTLLEKLRETRTVKIKGKNVDDLDLEKLSNLIHQANEKSSKVSLKGLFKKLKRSHPNTSSSHATTQTDNANPQQNSSET